MINYSDYELAVAILEMHEKALEQRRSLPSNLNASQTEHMFNVHFYLHHKELYNDMNESQKSVFGSGSTEEILESAKSYLLVYDFNEKFEEDLQSKEIAKNKNKI